MAPAATKTAMTKASLKPDVAGQVKQALASIESCSLSTVNALSDLLFPSKAPARSTGVNPKSTKKVKVTDGTASNPLAAALTIQERHRLATEITNLCLKAIGVYLKQEQEQKTATIPALPMEKRPVKLQSARNIQPLQSRNLNKSSPVSYALHPMVHTAECCRLAIRYLYSAENSPELEALPKPLQIEKAHHSLINKLIAIKMYELAIKELRSLKQRLEEFLEVMNSGINSWAVVGQLAKPTKSIAQTVRRANKATKEENKTEVQELGELLIFKTVSSSALDLIISFQISTLKCIVGSGKPQAIDVLPLVLSEPNNVYSLLKAVDSASTKLVSLDSLLISCCPSSSSSADISAKNSSTAPSPKTAFLLQTIVFEARISARLKTVDEVWEHFGRCLAALLRRWTPRDEGKERYTLIEEAVAKLQKEIEMTRQGNGNSPPDKILQMLSSAALDAGMTTEGVKWVEKASVAQEKLGKANDATRSGALVRIAALALREYFSSTDLPVRDAITTIESKIREALDSIGKISKARKEDLEKLVQEIALFRRAASAVATTSKWDEITELKESIFQLKESCSAVSTSAINFYRRYLSIQPTESEKIKKFAIPAMEFLISRARLKSVNVNLKEHWDSLDESLGACFELCKIMLVNIEEGEEQELDRESMSEKISATYWKIACTLKKQDAIREGLSAMKKSIHALLGRPKSETLRGGLVSRMEKLGNTYLQNGHAALAEEVFCEGIKVLSSEGVMEEVLEYTDRKSLEAIFHIGGVGENLGKLLDGLLRCAVQQSKRPSYNTVPFDDESLDRELRGLILEWELKGLAGLPNVEGRIAKNISSLLLSIYTDDEPLRRARVISRILRFELNHPNSWNLSEISELGDEVEAIKPLHRDHSLRPFKDHIIATCLTSYAFLQYRQGEPRPDMLKKAIIIWRELIESCQDWETVCARIDEPEDMLGQLQMLVDFSAMKGLSAHRTLALNTLLFVKALQPEIDYNDLVRLHSLLSIQYLRMGYSGKAGMTLARAQNWEKKACIHSDVRVQWHLAYTEYLVGIGNLTKAKEHYEAADAIVKEDAQALEPKRLKSKLERRVFRNRLIADASHVLSLLAFELGYLLDAIIHARRCVRLNQRSWTILEQLSKQNKAPYPQITPIRKEELELQKILEQLALEDKTSSVRSPIQSSTLQSLSSPLLWTLVPSMYQGLLRMSALYGHQGMAKEAQFNVEQTLKIAEVVQANPLIAYSSALSGELKTRAGELEEGANLLERALDLKEDLQETKEIVEVCCSLGILHHRQALYDEELESYLYAEKKLQNIMDCSFICDLDKLSSAEQELAVSLGNLGLYQQPEAPKRANSKRTAKKSSKAAATACGEARSDRIKSVLTECTNLQKLKGNLLRLKAYCLTMQESFSEADRYLQESRKLPMGYQEQFSQSLIEAKTLLSEGLYALQSDPVLNVLQDSILSIPNAAPPKTVTQTGAKGKTKKPNAMSDATVQDFLDCLNKARLTLAHIFQSAARCGCLSLVNSISSLLNSITILLASVIHRKGEGISNPVFANYPQELSKGLPLLREKDTLQSEKRDSEEELEWPSATSETWASFNFPSASYDFSEFQKEYIDIIPQDWIVVSISMNEERNELIISRLHAGEGPLMVRLPLGRNSSHEVKDAFDYSTALEELNEIVKLANVTAHQAKSATGGGKEAKTEWWEQRRALDERLEGLLDNIETDWLGGFRAIFGQCQRNPLAMRKFADSFETIMARYLPSRQQRGKKAPDNAISFDPRIYDLFLGLASPPLDMCDKGPDLEHPITDLLSFVIDTLSWHGEINAYDEIDFDPIVLELTEAIRAYHQSPSRESPKQTILILDKSVQMFPWESLSSLRGHAVSRLPSIQSLRQILLHCQMRHEEEKPGIYIDEKSGTYILNPTSDLTATQGQFEEKLKSLHTWTSITNRAPTEPQFSNSLSTCSLLLYFGHGSGGQYIRHRTVKKLDRCAVALLMGCSSGSVKDTGDFSPYGMPLSYLLGGSPAVVANLWDVTDRDIDRFTERVLDEWGLFETRAKRKEKMERKVSGHPVKTPGRARSKSRVRNAEKGKEEMTVSRPKTVADDAGNTNENGSIRTSLVEAVQRAREECKLRFLNGAAPVVYGVPVYLERPVGFS